MKSKLLIVCVCLFIITLQSWAQIRLGREGWYKPFENQFFPAKVQTLLRRTELDSLSALL